MSSPSTDPEQLVIGGILAGRTDYMQRARLRLGPGHFFGQHHNSIFKVIEAFYDRYGTIIEADLFAAVLSSRQDIESARRVALEQTFRVLAESHVPEHRFLWALDELIDRAARKRTGEAIHEAFEILERGWEDPEGKAGVVLHGHQEARGHLYARLSSIDRDEYGEYAPEGDMRRENEHALSDYSARKERDRAGEHIGVLSGLGCVDRTTGGLQPGELALAVGYTTAGKSHFCTNWAWYASVHGLDVTFFTTETIRDQVKRRLYARHSRLPMFGRPGGLNSKDIRNGTLNDADEEVFRAVVDDLDRNPAYGGIHLAQVPNQAPLSYVESRLREVGRQYDVRLCVIDYLALIRSDIKRQRAQEEYNDVLRGAKQMATSFNNGAGVPVLSPWQVQQAAYREAMKNRAYTLTNLADTSEAEKVSDTITAILREEDETRSARIQFLKVRDGDLPPIQEVEIDFRNSYYGDRVSMSVGGSTSGAVASGARSEIEDFLS